MERCIICREDKEINEFNEEHIIPESLGNKKLKIFDVCKICNSNLGATIDKGLTTNDLINFPRDIHQIKGKKEKILLPLAKGIDEEGNTIFLDSRFRPSLRTWTEVEGNRITIRTSDEKEGKEALKKIIKRRYKTKITDEKVDKLLLNCEMKRSKYFPVIKTEFTINIQKNDDGLIKIAYEYAYKNLVDEDYLNDEVGIKIAKYLFLKSRGKNAKYDGRIIPFDSEKVKLYSVAFEGKHYIGMQRVENVLLVTIILLGAPFLAKSIVVSENASNYLNVHCANLIPYKY